MSRKEDRLKNLTIIKDDETLYDEFDNESDRGHALLVAAALDVRLRDRIAGFLIDDPKIVDDLIGAEDHPGKPLGSFAVRINAAYCLGLITKKQYHNLDLIRQIRNHFAHNLHSSTFEEEPVKAWCAALEVEDADANLFEEPPRNWFTAVYTELAIDFEYAPKLQPFTRCKVRDNTVFDLVRNDLESKPSTTDMDSDA